MSQSDVVIYLPGGGEIDLFVMPSTYRIGIAPQFISRIAGSDPRGTDRARWKSWMQTRFDGGAGQLYWSSTGPTNRFAHSHLISQGNSPATPKSDIGIVADQATNLFLTENLDDNVLGDVAPAILPTMSTGFSKGGAYLFTLQHPVHIVEFSGKPHAFYSGSAMVYTNVTNTAAWLGGVLSGGVDNKLTGKWAVISTNADKPFIYDVVKYSGVIVRATAASGGAMVIYGSLNTAGQTPSVSYLPAYNTHAQALAVFDNKLWRAHKGQIAYLNPVTSSSNAVWSDYIPVGDAQEPIVKMKEFNGRLYTGKDDSLWAYENGQMFLIEDYSNEADPSNFQGMEVHRGALYFNIRSKLFRLTTGGLLEEIATPHKTGAIVGLESFGAKLYILFKQAWSPQGNFGSGTGDIFPTAKEQQFVSIFSAGKSERFATEVWVFDDQFRSMTRWFATKRVTHPESPFDLASIRGASGVLWMAPMVMTSAFSNTYDSTPIAAADGGADASLFKINPQFAPESEIITSLVDFGLPNLKKLFNALVVDYTLFNPASNINNIDVSYILDVEPKGKIEKVYTLGANFGVTVTERSSLIDGNFDAGSAIAIIIDDDPVSSTHEEIILIGTDKPLNYIYFQTDTSLPFDLGNYASAIPTVSWLTGALTKIAGAGPVVYAFNKKAKFQHAEFDDRINWKFDMTFGVYTQFKITAVEAIEFLDPGYDSSAITDETPRYWYTFRTLGQADGLTIIQVFAGGFVPFLDFETIEWKSLGSIGGSGDFGKTQKRLAFPTNTNSARIMLRFQFRAAHGLRPELRGYEVEYMEFPGDKKVVEFTALLMDDTTDKELVVGPTVNTIVTGLFSVALSGLTHVVRLPWPNDPASSTIRAKISISPPGLNVPLLVDDIELSGTSGATVPLKIDEV